MLTGRRAFLGGAELAAIYAILNEEPVALSSLLPDIPGFIDNVVMKALRKDVHQRYQSIGDFAADLRKACSAPAIAEPKEKSIVVLPFENMSPEKENEYFSDGLTEEIITDLSQIKKLQVISRTSAMQLKGTDKNIKTIGRELNVQYVLEGSVRKHGNNLWITAQLIDADNDIHLWAEKYRGTMDDVFDIQEKVSRSIADALKLKLSPEEYKRIAERPIADIKAYECYL
jgi:TolB-like protein